MGSELVGDTPLTEEAEKKSASSYTATFWEVLPAYIAMGMTTDEFWRGDPQLAVAYRKSQEIKNERDNSYLWLSGLYIYQAILLCAPRLNSIKPMAPSRYPEKPFALKEEAPKEDPNIIKMKAWMARVNKHYGS